VCQALLFPLKETEWGRKHAGNDGESRGNIENTEERRGIKIEVNSNKNKKNKFI